MLRDFIENILNNYLDAKKSNYTENELAKLIRTEMPQYLEKITDNNFIYGFQGSAGRGTWTHTPWVAILDKRITNSVRTGFFPVYLFRQDMQGVYLLLMFGTEEFEKKFGRRAKEELKSEVSKIREKNPNIFDFFSDEEIDLASDSNNSKASLYEAGNIVAKYYDANNLPSEDELISDYNEILKVYNNIKGSIGLLSDENIKELLNWCVTSSQKYKEYGPPRKECEEFNHKWIQPDIIKKMSDEDLKNHFLDYFNKGTGKKQFIVAIPRAKIINNENFRDSLIHLLDEDIPDDIRINDLLDIRSDFHIEGMGKALVTAFLMDFKPKKYCLWNGKTEDGLKALGWEKYYHDKGDSEGKKYLKVLALLKKLKDLDSTLGLEYIDIDLFLHIIAAEEEGIREINRIKNGDKINIRESLVEIFDKLPIAWANKEIVKGHPIGQVFFKLSSDIQTLANLIYPEKNYHSEGYYRHTNQWYKRPYVYIENSEHKDIFSTWDQHIVEFMFNEDLTGVYLTIKQSRGYARGLLKEKNEEYTEQELDNYMKTHEKECREFLIQSGSVSNELLEETSRVSLWNDVILGKYYDKSDLPSNEQLISDFKDIFNLYSLLKPDEVGEGGIDMEENITFFDYLTIKGYFFNKELVENFLLSLKVKPFVILTGNSGTGKTKVAQLFAQYLNNSEHTPEEKYKNIFSMKRSITTYSRKNNGGWRLQPTELEELQQEYNLIELPDDLTLQINHEGKYINGKGYLQRKLHSFKDSPIYLYYESDGPIHEVLSNSDGEVIINFIKKEINQSSDYRKYEIVPVGANWTENRHILGFYNVILGDYYFTKALELVINAQNDKKNPHFLILDEMNLSHVERYFSDFLSAMESGEEIELHRASENELDDNLNIPSLPPEKIKLSENLSVIGTVNIDETTYMFSPKVLDRANTLEFLTQPAEDYMNGSPEYLVNGDVKYLQDPLSDIEIRDENINDLKIRFAGVKTNTGQELWNVLSNKINLYQEILKEADFDFGFRTINEIVRFMYVAWRYENEPPKWDNWERYFDAQIMQKILPKLHGSQKEISSVLGLLENECNAGNYPVSTSKLNKMIKTLKDKRYVAFTG